MGIFYGVNPQPSPLDAIAWSKQGAKKNNLEYIST
jgi:hypothetical protein